MYVKGMTSQLFSSIWLFRAWKPYNLLKTDHPDHSYHLTPWTNWTTLTTPTDQTIYQDKRGMRIVYLVLFDKYSFKTWTMQPRSLTYSLPGAANFVTQIYLQYLRRFTCLAKARNKMQKIVKENQNSIETLPWWCIEYEWREDKGCPRSHLSRPETSTWNLSFFISARYPPIVCLQTYA